MSVTFVNIWHSFVREIASFMMEKSWTWQSRQMSAQKQTWYPFLASSNSTSRHIWSLHFHLKNTYLPHKYDARMDWNELGQSANNRWVYKEKITTWHSLLKSYYKVSPTDTFPLNIDNYSLTNKMIGFLKNISDMQADVGSLILMCCKETVLWSMLECLTARCFKSILPYLIFNDVGSFMPVFLAWDEKGLSCINGLFGKSSAMITKLVVWTKSTLTLNDSLPLTTNQASRIGTNHRPEVCNQCDVASIFSNNKLEW